MKRLILPAALVLALAGSVAFAQQPAPAPDATAPPMHQHHAPNAQKELAHMTKALNLTPDQAAKIQPILADRDQKIAALQADTTLTDDARAQQMKAIHHSTEQQVHGILTPDQLAQAKSMHHGHGGAPPDGAQPMSTPPSA